jgi:arylsulfatase A-like enzyme
MIANALPFTGLMIMLDHVFPLLLLGCTVAADAPNNPAGRGDLERPNVIFIVLDDAGRDQFNYLPEGRDEQRRPRNLTPHLDRLAAEGVILDQQYVSTSVCTPSRFSCLTGRYASRARDVSLENKSWDEGQIRVGWNTHIYPEDMTLPKLLQQSGYATGMVGKNHTIAHKHRHKIPRKADPADPEIARMLRENYAGAVGAIKRCGFDYAASIYQHNLPGLACAALEVHNVDWIARGAVEFIDRYHDRPFFLYMCFTTPHGPFQNWAWKANPLATPAGLLEEPLRLLPGRDTLLPRLKEAGLDEKAADMLWMDDALGAVMERLQSHHVDDRTVVIIFNDHGVEAGKGSCYQGGVWTQGLVWAKSRFPGRRRLKTRVSNIDFAPTILDVCGALPRQGDHPFDGRSFRNLLEGEEESPLHDSLYFEIGCSRAVLKGQWKYLAVRFPDEIRNMPRQRRQALVDKYLSRRAEIGEKDVRGFAAADKPFGHIGDMPGGRGSEQPAIRFYSKHYHDADQLYDLKADPDEQNNLAAERKYAKVLSMMKEELQRHLMRVPGGFGEFNAVERTPVEEGQSGRRPAESHTF